MKLTFPHTLTCGSLQAQVPLGSLLSVEFVNSDLAAAIDPATCLDVAPDLEIEQERELFEAFKAHRRDFLEARGIYAPRTARCAICGASGPHLVEGQACAGGPRVMVCLGRCRGPRTALRENASGLRTAGSAARAAATTARRFENAKKEGA